MTYPALEAPKYVLAFDANGDGKVDLVTGDDASARFSVLLALK